MDTKDVIQRFYDGLARKDSSWQDNLAESVAFADASGKLGARGREAFIGSFSGFLRAVDQVQLKQLIVEGTNAAAVVSYDYVNPAGVYGPLRLPSYPSARFCYRTSIYSSVSAVQGGCSGP